MAKVVGGPVTRFSREQNELDVLRQTFTELRKLVFVAKAEELLNAINTEELYVTRVDGFTLNHVGDASSGSNDDMGSFLQPFPILVGVSPTYGEVESDGGRYGGSGYPGVHCLCSLAGWTQDDRLGPFGGAVQLVDNHVRYRLCFSW